MKTWYIGIDGELEHFFIVFITMMTLNALIRTVYKNLHSVDLLHKGRNNNYKYKIKCHVLLVKYNESFKILFKYSSKMQLFKYIPALIAVSFLENSFDNFHTL